MTNHESPNSFVLCIDDGGYPASLEVRKVYVSLPDKLAAERGHIRVIDETGEDYLYPAELFVPVKIPPQAASLLQPLVTMPEAPKAASHRRHQGRNRR